MLRSLVGCRAAAERWNSEGTVQGKRRAHPTAERHADINELEAELAVLRLRCEGVLEQGLSQFEDADVRFVFEDGQSHRLSGHREMLHTMSRFPRTWSLSATLSLTSWLPCGAPLPVPPLPPPPTRVSARRGRLLDRKHREGKTAGYEEQVCVWFRAHLLVSVSVSVCGLIMIVGTA